MESMATSQAMMEELEGCFAAADALDRPLSYKLARFVDLARRVAPSLLAAEDRLIARLGIAGVGRSAPNIGEALPGFTLPDLSGRMVNLSTLVSNGPVVISINRGHWCPYDRLQLRDLLRAHLLLPGIGPGVLSIVPDLRPFAARLARGSALPLEILMDIEQAYAASLGLVTWIGDEMISALGACGIDLPRFHSTDGWLLPVPATFLVGRDQRVLARHVTPDFRNRMTAEEIELANRQLHDRQHVKA
jgi:peroxiredoxin